MSPNAAALLILDHLLELLPGEHDTIHAELQRCTAAATATDRSPEHSALLADVRNSLRVHTPAALYPEPPTDLGWLCANALRGIEVGSGEYTRLALVEIARHLPPGSLVVWFLRETDEPIETYPQVLEFLTTPQVPDAVHRAGRPGGGSR